MRNPLESPSTRNPRTKATKAILNFYKQQLEQEIDRLYEAKFLIIGEGGAGKTSLAKKIEDENYKLKPEEESTEGIDVIQWKFTQTMVKNFALISGILVDKKSTIKPTSFSSPNVLFML